MPRTKVVFYREDDGTVPVLDWLSERTAKAREKCLVRLDRLEELGHELRRPVADYLRDGIHELRMGLQGVNYRLLYFFHGRSIVVVTHGLVKERKVPAKEIDKAVKRRRQFEQDSESHTFRPE